MAPAPEDMTRPGEATRVVEAPSSAAVCSYVTGYLMGDRHSCGAALVACGPRAVAAGVPGATVAEVGMAEVR